MWGYLKLETAARMWEAVIMIRFVCHCSLSCPFSAGVLSGQLNSLRPVVSPLIVTTCESYGGSRTQFTSVCNLDNDLDSLRIEKVAAACCGNSDPRQH